MDKSLTNKSILCSICARGGSQGVKNKNIRLLQGKPLIAHSILQAQKTGVFSKIVVSSDSDDILAVAKQFGADYLIKRPAELATATAAKVPVIKHAFLAAEEHFSAKFDIAVDLDATSPLRKPADILGSIELLLDSSASNVMSGCPARRSPYFNLVELQKSGNVDISKAGLNIKRRQDAPVCYDLNASIYVWCRDSLLKEDFFTASTRLFVMAENSAFDIDSNMDFKIVEMLAKESALL